MRLLDNWKNARKFNSYKKKIDAIDFGLIQSNVNDSYKVLGEMYKKLGSWEAVSKEFPDGIKDIKSFTLIDTSILKIQICGIEIDENDDNKIKLHMTTSFSEEEEDLIDFISFYNKDIRNTLSLETKDVYVIGADIADTVSLIEKYVNMMGTYILFLEREYEYSIEINKMCKKIPFKTNKVWEYIPESGLGTITSFLEYILQEELQKEEVLIIKTDSSINIYKYGEKVSFITIIISYKEDIDIKFSDLSLEKSEYYLHTITDKVENIVNSLKEGSKTAKVETEASVGLEETLSEEVLSKDIPSTTKETIGKGVAHSRKDSIKRARKLAFTINRKAYTEGISKIDKNEDNRSSIPVIDSEKEINIQNRRKGDIQKENMPEEEKKLEEAGWKQLSQYEKKRMERGDIDEREKAYTKKAMSVCFREGDDVLISSIMGTLKSKIYMLASSPISEEEKKESLLDILDFIDQDLLNHIELVKILNKIVRIEFEYISRELKVSKVVEKAKMNIEEGKGTLAVVENLDKSIEMQRKVAEYQKKVEIAEKLTEGRVLDKEGLESETFDFNKIEKTFTAVRKSISEGQELESKTLVEAGKVEKKLKKIKKKFKKGKRTLDKQEENMTEEEIRLKEKKKKEIDELERKRMANQKLEGLEKEYFEKAMSVCFREGDDVLISRIIGTLKSKVYMLVLAPISEKQKKESLLDIMDFIDQDLWNHVRLIKILNEFVKAEFKSVSEKNKNK